MPLEAKYAADNGEAHKINIIKTEAGHTLGFNNVAGKETLFLVDWTGQGIFEIPLCLDCWRNFVSDSDVIHAVAEKLRAESGNPGRSQVSWVSLAPQKGGT